MLSWSLTLFTEDLPERQAQMGEHCLVMRVKKKKKKKIFLERAQTDVMCLNGAEAITMWTPASGNKKSRL